jgi:hypothetical protein
LAKNTYYAIQLIAKWTKAVGPAQPNPQASFTDLTTKTLNYNNVLYAKINSRVLNENKLALASSNEMKLYEVRFRTSQYNDFTQKMDNTITKAVKYKVKKLESSTPQSVWVYETNLSTTPKIAAAIRGALGMSAAQKPIIRYTEIISQRGTERFDHFDLNPYKKPMPWGQVYRAPKLVYNSADAKAFHKKLNDKLVKILQTSNLAQADLDMLEGVNGKYYHSMWGSPTIKLTWEEGLTQQVPYHVPSFVDPNDFLSTENANTTVGSITNGHSVINFSSKWLDMADDEPTNNPHIYTGNFMNQNGFQPNAASDYEKMGQAMDAVDEELNALQTDNLMPKPTVKSAASKAAKDGGNGATGGGK